MKKLSTNSINFEIISEGLGLNIEDCKEFFNDGRIMGRLGEFKYKQTYQGERQNENAKFDVKNIYDERIEIRSITKKVCFASSKEVGFGRKVTEDGWYEKMNSIDKYVLLDIRKLNDGLYDFIEVQKEDLESLSLGKNKSISSDKFFKIYDSIK
jgi:hypothetical protein